MEYKCINLVINSIYNKFLWLFVRCLLYATDSFYYYFVIDIARIFKCFNDA